jgi:hypothetical protein
MPLTPEQRARDAARLESLIADSMAALAAKDLQAKADALIALTDYQATTTDIALIRRAEESRAAAANNLVDAGLTALRAIAARLDPLGATLAECALIARDGKANLLFPRVAASADHMLQVVTELQETADKLKETAGNAQKLGDVPDAIKAVKTALEQLKAKTPRA